MVFWRFLSFLLLCAFSLQGKEGAIAVPSGHNIFSSKVYDSYLEQLQNFVHKELTLYPELDGQLDAAEKYGFEAEMFELVALLKDSQPLILAEGKRALHQKMIGHLRSALEQREWALVDGLPKAASAFLDDLCTWMYTIPQIHKQTQDFLLENFSGAFTHQFWDSWIGQLEYLHHSIRHDERFGSLIEEDFYDAHFFGDIPSHLFSLLLLENQKEIKVIRTPNPTFEHQSADAPGQRDRRIAPEFYHYLVAAAQSGRTHLYINYAERQSEGDQEEISHLLEQLEIDPAIEPAYMIISLARNSAFYKQTGQFANFTSAFLFKESFLQELFVEAGTSFYYWSKKLSLPQWESMVGGILNNVHAHYFAGKEILTLEERKEFIDIAYTKMVENLITLFQPDVVNLSCRISIDRGPTGFTLLYSDLLLEQKEDIDQKDVKNIATLAYGPAAVSRNRSVSSHHNTRFLRALERLQSGQRHPFALQIGYPN